MRELVAIIGMHRSGTSMVAKLTHALGIRVVGDERHLGKGNVYNRAGYWETPELVTLNDRLLAFLGGDWRHVPPMPPGWAQSPLLAPYRRRARALVAAIPGERRAWKDPRLTLTLPFWKQVVPATQYVLCFRNPLDVHRSLAHRDGIGLAEAMRLWGLYSAAALRETIGERRLLLFYDDFFDPARAPLRDLAGFLEVPAAAPAAVIDADLRHHRATTADVLAHPEVPDAVKTLWDALEAYRRADRRDDAEAELNRLALQFRDTTPRSWRERLPHYVKWIGGTVKMMTKERPAFPTER